MSLWQAIAAAIGEAQGQPVPSEPRRPVGGGCINQAFVLGSGPRRAFVKLNRAALSDMFAAECAGLEALAACGAIRVPTPWCHGVHGEQAFLALEWLPLGGAGDPAAAGRALAALHRHGAATFGWRRDNYIGATPQPNTPAGDWAAFWREQRLGYQLELAARNGHARALRGGAELQQRLSGLFERDPPRPSLLHGDLWGGNFAWHASGAPVLYDPAVYYGDRLADLAMTELFGGFGPAFHAAYAEAWPLDPGYETRKLLYNLYHVLNHLNLFGGGYLDQAKSMIARLLAELR